MLTIKDIHELEHPQILGGTIKEAKPRSITVTRPRPSNRLTISPEKPRERKPKNKPKQANSKGKKARGRKVKNYQDSHKIKNSMQEALGKIINPPQNATERSLDTTRDYWKIRDNGQFGSHPSHDDFDE